ncbi:nuclear transport factor 2 family protein [Flavobacterium sp. TP390]|uniref:Nuclear transport factor 2 family protein n=1 Tax=Flavobacterium profundi TaxID=1774945 RepID=A0A6I4IDD3_9FLAO|nr:nuclear transport factor 2 family protein [Flavobacterium profundi]MVO07653.1 nuclear transport factor 2 family protein [Flavobacterium profundi]
MTKKEIVTHFLHLAAKGQSREAFEVYVAPDFIHHNAYFKGDRNTLMLAMEENAIQNPNKIFEIQRILEDEHLVAVHSRIQLQQNNLELAVMHIFRFNENKIVELWDFGQPVPKDIINENGMF